MGAGRGGRSTASAPEVRTAPVGGTIGFVPTREGRLSTTSTPPTGRRFTDGTHAPATVVGRGTRIRGDLASGEPVEIHGTLEGDCQTSAHCVIHEQARVTGNVAAAGLIVAGEVEAGVIAAEKVEIRASARVLGTVRARVVVIADGAFYEGHVEDAGDDGPALLKDRREGPTGA
jgi:cytoskeletal protein CcmA (bactofilin family)